MNTSPDNLSAGNGDSELIRRARALHEHACEHVDARTRVRLHAARRRALDSANSGTRRIIWLPAAGAVAACALAAGVLWLRPQPAQAPVAQGTADAALPLDADAQQLDLYQNLDFYQWLARQPQTRAGGGGRQ